MIRLYHAGGSGEIQLLGNPLSSEDWTKLRLNACRLLRARNFQRAAQLLESIPFEIRDGTNVFCDEFSLLYLSASLERYVEMGERVTNEEDSQAFRQIARVISEVGPYIRFVAVELDTKAGPAPVMSPNLAITSDAVERALKDAEQLILAQGAVSGVDRAHTAFHGYLKAVCLKQSIPVTEDAGVIDLFKLIQNNHPKLNPQGARARDVIKIGRAMASILDALNPLRNRATLAHPNDILLKEPEAMLVINSIRTLLHYLNSKFQ
ncbi:MAG: abortive infection family protein [Gammaproteobacteria bacterium]